MSNCTICHQDLKTDETVCPPCDGQSRIAYSSGESLTYRGEGIVIKTVDGGDTWTRLTLEDIPGLEAMSFADLKTGYAAGWDNYIIKTTDGGATWETVPRAR